MRPISAARLSLLGLALLAASVASMAAGATAGNQQLTIYARATQAAFLSHADDRTRGDFTNPFNTDTKIVPPPKDLKGSGGLPGDNALFTFKLYSDPTLKTSIGSATYACTFNFAHHALCEADFELNSATLTAVGQADFNATRFTLAVTSGTGKYLGVRGQVTSSPASKNVHRLAFLLN